MKILYLGYAIDSKLASKQLGASIAGNKMQLNILENLSKFDDVEIDVITLYPTAVFPRTKNILIKREKISLTENLFSTKVFYINLPLIKQIWSTFSIYLEAKKTIKEHKIEKIFTFNMFPQIGFPSKWIKKKYGIEVITLLADLPIDDTIGRKGISLILRNFFDYFTRNLILVADKIVTLNEYAIKLYAPNTKFIVVEGGIEKPKELEKKEDMTNQKNLVYSGALTEYSGILNLIDAMRLVKNKDIYLEIYGGGQLEERIKDLSKKLGNVKYCGRVDNITMQKIQRSAYLLINPRPIEDLIAKVTFPSKIFEYMLSGTAVITTKLNGFREEYLDKMYFVNDNTPEKLAKMIDEVARLSIEEIILKGKIAQDFVIKEKTWEKQCEKIKDFINENKN